ncbi:MAG: hypothetical protein K2X53_04775 [Alphaproteobacteria bacterium]|nr:hypothetical protein [Alphaproteobacteria bacterium]
MTKLICKILMTSTFSLFLINQGANASSDVILEENADHFSCPKISTQGNDPLIIRKDQEKEYEYLENAIVHLSSNKVEQATECFKNAVDINGSPLGYLYLAAIWNDARYHLIVRNALKFQVISWKTVSEHANFLSGHGYKFDLKAMFPNS